MPLKGIKVIELAGLAPGPFCGMILSDFGASVVRIDRVRSGGLPDKLARGKRSIAVDLKDSRGQALIQNLAAQSDVLIEPYRPGVMEKLNLGPSVIMERNPRLIYARLSGYGQTGPYAQAAGHDINYIAISGILSKLGRCNDLPTAPINLLADFAGGGLTCAFGILLSLFERKSSGKGQIVDVSMTEGAAYVSSFIFKSQSLPIWGKARGQNLLDGGAPFYDTYETKDGKYMAVGSLEPQFYGKLMEGLQLEIPQFTDFISSRQSIKAQFLSKTQAEWTEIFSKLDACVTPVRELAQAHQDPQNMARSSFIQNSGTGQWEPKPAPLLSRTPGTVTSTSDPLVGEHSVQILKEFGYNQSDSLDKIREEFKSDSEGAVQGDGAVTTPSGTTIPGPQGPSDLPRKHSSSTYRRASQIDVEISLDDMRAQTRGVGGRFRHAMSGIFGRRAKVSQTDSHLGGGSMADGPEGKKTVEDIKKPKSGTGSDPIGPKPTASKPKDQKEAKSNKVKANMTLENEKATKKPLLKEHKSKDGDKEVKGQPAQPSKTNKDKVAKEVKQSQGVKPEAEKANVEKMKKTTDKVKEKPKKVQEKGKIVAKDGKNVAVEKSTKM